MALHSRYTARAAHNVAQLSRLKRRLPSGDSEDMAQFCREQAALTQHGEDHSLWNLLADWFTPNEGP